jgi:hypothetical protein
MSLIDLSLKIDFRERERERERESCLKQSNVLFLFILKITRYYKNKKGGIYINKKK